MHYTHVEMTYLLLQCMVLCRLSAVVLIVMFFCFFLDFSELELSQYVTESVIKNDDSDEVEILNLSEPLFGFRQTKVLVRSHYKMLFNIIKTNQSDTMVLLGNPGIGKSLFGFYLLHCFSKKMPEDVEYIIYVSINAAFNCILQKDNVKYNMEHTGVHLEVRRFMHNNREKSWFVFDAANKDYLHLFPVECKKNIIISSPDPRNFEQSIKDAEAVCLYMPCWTKEEMKLLSWKMDAIGQDIFEERFILFGGIPRYVFGKIEFSVVKQEIVKLSFEKLLNLKLVGSSAEVSSDITHKIIERKPNVYKRGVHAGEIDYFKHSVQFISPKVSQLICSRYKKEISERIFSRVNSGTKLTGDFFETVIHSYLQASNKYSIRSLHDNTQGVLELPALEHIFFDMKDLHDNVGKREVYLQPTHHVLGALDALVLLDNKTIGFQITIKKSHNIKKQPLEELRKALNIKEIDVYFVVPEYIFNNYYNERQKFEGVSRNVLKRGIPKGVHQYVLKIDKTVFPASPQ